ncbi:unnamed protein product, partial [Heterosigma akashiwo]
AHVSSSSLWLGGALYISHIHHHHVSSFIFLFCFWLRVAMAMAKPAFQWILLLISSVHGFHLLNNPHVTSQWRNQCPKPVFYFQHHCSDAMNKDRNRLHRNI